MESGRLTSRALVRAYLRRIDTIDRSGPGRVGLRSVLEVNPDAEPIAAALDDERRHDGPRGPLHGIPVLVKDNMDSADRLHTSAGSLALAGSRPRRDATVVERLRVAGAVILGKANLSEWSNIRSPHSSSGWSARGGQTRNPYSLDRSPSGSSSGSAAAVAANLATATLGTETDAATVLGALVGVDARDPATSDSEGRFHTNYRRFLDAGALHGARIGIPREVFYGYSPPANQVAEEAIEALRSAGAEVVDPADIPGAREMAGFTGERELEVLLYELKHDLGQYLAERDDPRIRSLADVIAFNDAHADRELRHFGQEFFLAAQGKGPLTEPAYLEALASNRRLAREQGIDKVLEDLGLDALMVPTSTPPWTIAPVNGDHVLGEGSTPAALAGYPAVSVPAGYVDGLPVGVTFFGTAWSEPTLIRLAYAFEQATKVRRPPRFQPGGLDHKVRS